jgi:very-short-patch-repair endonuclease
MSISEKWFWNAVRKDQLGYRVRRQVPIGPYILDFYIPSVKVCIEVDGEQHELRRVQDSDRDVFLAEFGILTLRIPSLDLFYQHKDRLDHWLQVVRSICDSRNPKSFTE